MNNDIIGRRQIAEGVYFSRVTDSRYKKNRISVRFYDTIKEETAAENAAVPYVLSNCCGRYPTQKLLSGKLSALYGATVAASVGKKYDLQYCGLTAFFLDDIYALSGEALEDEVTDILIDCLFDPPLEDGGFLPRVLDVERRNVVDAIETLINDKGAYASYRAHTVICRDEPASVFTYGTAERAKALTPSGVYAAYRRLTENTHCEIICVGCSDFGIAEKKLTEAFSRLGRKNISEYRIIRSPIKKEPEALTERLCVNQTKMVIAFKTQSDDNDALAVMSNMYGGNPNSLLFMNVREKMSLCYYCSSSIDTVKGIMTVSCGVESDNTEKAKNEIMHQLELIKRGEFSDDAVNAAKMLMKNIYGSVNDSAASVCEWYGDRIIRNDIVTPQERLERLLKVTRERVINAAASMTPDTVYVLTSQEGQAL